MYFPDGNGIPHIINLTDNEIPSRARLDSNVGDHVHFELYTR